MSQSKNIPPHFRKLYLIILFTLVQSVLFGQEFLVIDTLVITGNQKTRDYIILKEVDLNPGDTLFQELLPVRLESNRNRLLNTGLFNKVVLSVRSWDLINKRATLEIKLVENWYWYPAPVFELADRNINEWLYQHKASFKRLNLGIRFMHINLTGNSDKLKFTYHSGFTDKYEIDYTFPYIKKNKSIGAYINMLYVTHKEIAFETLNNKLNFTRSEAEPLLTRFRTSVGLKHRKDNSFFQTVYLEYHNRTIADTISSYLNPAYFNLDNKNIEHLSLYYRLLYTDVDKKIYPTKGFRFMADARKEGIGVFREIDNLFFSAAWEHHIKPVDWFSSGYKIKVRKSFNFGADVPYAYLVGMGYYDDILTGYQLYVIDGNDFAYLKTFQKICLLDQEFDADRFIPFYQFKYLPLKIYIALQADIGIAYEDRFSDINPFNNRMIFGAGLGLDLVIYENYYLSLSYSVNHTGESGIFFKGTNTFE